MWFNHAGRRRVHEDFHFCRCRAVSFLRWFHETSSERRSHAVSACSTSSSIVGTWDVGLKLLWVQLLWSRVDMCYCKCRMKADIPLAAITASEREPRLWDLRTDSGVFVLKEKTAVRSPARHSPQKIVSTSTAAKQRNQKKDWSHERTPLSPDTAAAFHSHRAKNWKNVWFCVREETSVRWRHHLLQL